MPDLQLSLDANKLNNLFPFHLVLNQDLVIEQCGKSWQKWLPVKTGDLFTNLFLVSQPALSPVSFDSLAASTHQLIILDTPDGKYRWKGQLEYLETDKRILLAGYPNLNSIDEIAAQKLIETDFSVANPLIHILRLAKEEVEKAGRAKQIFLANMSHEIRTPMNGILGISNLLYKTNLTPKQKQFTKLIIESGNNLLHIVNDILDLTKIESGQFNLESTPFDLTDKIHSALQAFHFKAEDKGIELGFVNKLKKDLIVEGDPYRLGQILSNLLSNALKFTAEGSVILSVEQVAGDTKTPFFEIRIADTGMGISEENLATIFDQFVQAGPEITRKYGGTGLGLSISRNLVEMQGGRITVESKQGEGSTFIVNIPYKLSSESILKKELRKSGGMKIVEKQKILVAEDVPVNQLIAKHILKGWGHMVAIAENGKEVLKMLERSHFDLVLMDIHMPEMNGVVTTRLIRKLSNYKKANIPIIAVTAAAFKDEIERYLEAGMNDFITKPYTEEKLFEVIKRVMKLDQLTKNGVSELNTLGGDSMEKLYDLATLNQFGDNDQQFIKEIVTVFVTNGRIDLEMLEAAIEANNMPEIFQVAHRMKSTLHTMGIHSLETVIKTINAYSKNNDYPEEIPKLFEQVKQTLLIVFEQLVTDFSLI